MTTTQDRALGSFIGLAVGDALGAPIEFKEPGEFTPITTYVGGGPFNLPSGYWTDDTSMAICLAEHIIAKNTIDGDDLLARFARWYVNGENSSTSVCFDIGNTTRANIVNYMSKGKYVPAPNLAYQSGNGSIMRLSPVAVRWHNSPDLLWIHSRKQSLTTHGSDECLDACAELATLLGEGIRGDDVLSKLQGWAQALPLHEVTNSGRASHTLTAAKWAVGSTDNFADAVLKAVNLGGDADTIGAVAGQIAGSIYGLVGIPHEWQNNLYDVTRLMSLARKLYSE
jgi:ADP-ribosyl-[dinitrogen reductase] hydrolase